MSYKATCLNTVFITLHASPRNHLHLKGSVMDYATNWNENDSQFRPRSKCVSIEQKIADI